MNDMKMNKAKKRMSRDERKAYIKGVLDQQAVFGKKWATMYDIAKWIGMSPSTHLMGYLNEMVDDGIVNVYRDFYRPGVIRNWFSTKERIEQDDLFHVKASGGSK